MTTVPFLFYLTRSSLKKRLLVHFFTHPREKLYLREIAAKLRGDPANLSRELKTLEKEGVFISEIRGLHKYFSLNQSYPLYEELRSIILKITSFSPAEETRTSFRKERTPAPNVYIVAGPNGAGKTTFARKFLPTYAHCRQFVNADLIAGGIAPFSPEGSAIQAGKLLLEQIRSFSKKGIDFGFETTLAGKSYRNLLAGLRREGYKLHLFFLWIPTLEMALSRIEDRVRRGGHSIPKPVVGRRFGRGIRHLFELYRPLVDLWVIFDNSGSFPHLIATGTASDLKVLDQSLFDKIKKQAGVEIR